MQFVRRSQWGAVPARRYTSSDPRGLAGVVVHWFGKPKAASSHAGCPALLRAVQRGHMAPGGLGVAEGGSDIGYNIAVCPHGVIYEGRGFYRQTGANGTTRANRDFGSVVVMMGLGDKLSGEAKLCVSEVIAEYRRLGAGPRVVCHGEITGSDCPGDELEAWVIAKGYEMLKPVSPEQPHNFFTWARWWRGHAEFKPFGPRNPRVRPNVPTNITRDRPHWWVRLALNTGAK